MLDQPRYPTLIPLPDELRSGRLVLRPYRLEDAEALYAAIDESRGHLAPWMPWLRHYRDIDDARDFCLQSAARWLQRADLALGIFNALNGRFLGSTGLHRFDWHARTFEVGYWLRQSATGQGYASEAVRLQARLAFAELDARRLELRCDSRNVASRRVAERLGFVFEGQLRNDSLDPDGEIRDTLVFSLIPADYLRLRDTWWPG